MVPHVRGYYNNNLSLLHLMHLLYHHCVSSKYPQTWQPNVYTYLLTWPRREVIQHFHFPWRYATETSSITLHIIQYITATHRYNNSCTFRITVHKDIQHSQCLTLNMWGRVQMTKKYIHNGTKNWIDSCYGDNFICWLAYCTRIYSHPYSIHLNDAGFHYIGSILT